MNTFSSNFINFSWNCNGIFKIRNCNGIFKKTIGKFQLQENLAFQHTGTSQLYAQELFMEITRYPFSSLLHKTINGEQSMLMIFCNYLCWSLRASQIINFHKTCEISSCMICLSDRFMPTYILFWEPKRANTMELGFYFVFRTLDITERALLFKTYLSLNYSCKGFTCLPNKAYIFKAVRQILFLIGIPKSVPTGSQQVVSLTSNSILDPIQCRYKRENHSKKGLLKFITNNNIPSSVKQVISKK